MAGRTIAYIRVSPLDPKATRPGGHVPCHKKFLEKRSGGDTRRPQREAMLLFVRAGDTVICPSMDQLAQDIEDLRNVVQELVSRGVHLRFLREDLTFAGKEMAMTHDLLKVVEAVAEFDRHLSGERQREAIALAKKAHLYMGRRPALSMQQASELRRRFEAGDLRATLAKEFGISKETVYRYAGKRGPFPGVGYQGAESITGGRIALLSAKQLEKLRERVYAGEKKAQLAAEYGISRMTLHRYVSGQVKPLDDSPAPSPD